MSKLMADVSKHNETVDFEKMKKAGVAAVVIRAGYRTAKAGKIEADPRYAENVRKAEKAGLPLGIYWWTTAMSVKEAESEANACINLAQGHKISLPIWLDLEYYNSKREGRADHLSAAARTTYALAFLERCRKLGYEAGVYCNPDFWKDALVPDKLKTYPRWIAHYGKSAGMPCDIWQYTSIASGKTYGTGSAYIDLSAMYTDFTAGRKSMFAEDTNVPVSITGNPYRAPALTVASDAQAKKCGLKNWSSSGTDVKAFQWELKRLGYDIGASGIDGKCGQKTDAAIGQAQAEFGLKVDRLGGPRTWAAITTAKERPQANTKPEKVNYRERVAAKSKVVYPFSLGKKHGSGVQKKVKTFAQFKAQDLLNCHLMVSLVLQEAGCLPKGCVITHTPKDHVKKKITDAVKGTENLRHCKVYWVDKPWKDLPDKWKKPGVVYIQKSNACISAGGGSFWSCNNGNGERYRRKSDYLRSSGYVLKSNDLVVIVPDGD